MSNLRRITKILLWFNTFAALVFLVGIMLSGKPMPLKIMSAAGTTPIPLSANLGLKPGMYSEVLAGTSVFLYLPDTQTTTQPAHILVALHGINGSGEIFGSKLIEFARQNGLVLLAPTFKFEQNWQNPQIVAEEDSQFSAQLNLIMEELKRKIQPIPLNNRLLLYGFSRGAQLAHRYALLYPEKTLGIAILSAGSYTLPLSKWVGQNGLKELPFPFGVSNLDSYRPGPFDEPSFRKIRFLIEVGTLDNDPAQTPVAWDAYLGKGRVERAGEFNRQLTLEGLNSRLILVPGTGHTENTTMRAPALQFFRELLAPIPSG